MSEDVKKAKSILDQGDVIGLPTETVYGLAARIDLPGAIEKIFKTKERPFFDPLIVHVHSIDQARKLTTNWGPVAEALAKAFWPGPLTLILPKSADVSPVITSGLDSVGIRMPNHAVALDILKTVAIPLAAPSANKFGKTSPTSAEHVRAEFSKEQVFVVDGGPCDIGIESTVLSVKEQQGTAVLSVLRKGHVLKTEIEKVLSEQGLSFVFTESVDKKESPGHMKHHYMPAIPFFLCQSPHRSVTELLAEVNQKLSLLPDEIDSIKIFKPKEGLKTLAVLKLSADPVIAAREFYSELRKSALSGSDGIVFYQETHHEGERWEPLWDRLTKAASLVLS